MKSGYAAPRRRLQWRATAWIGLAASLLLGSAHAQPAPGSPTTASSAVQSKQDLRARDPQVVLVMGDSLSAAYGLAAEQGWVAMLGERIGKQMPGWKVVNASISGETTAGGASRIVDAVVRDRPSVVVIELGANDALRGLPLRESRRNLARMIGAAQGVGAKVLLLGMRMPPNYGPDYTTEFERGYRDLSTRFNTVLDPFFLAPIAADRANFQADNLHPTAAAQPAIADQVWKSLQPLLHASH